MIQKIEDFVRRWWFALSSVALAILYVLYDKRGRRMDEIKADAERQVLGAKLQGIREQSTKSREDFNNAVKNYEDLRRIHGDVLKRHGLSRGDDKPKT